MKTLSILAYVSRINIIKLVDTFICSVTRISENIIFLYTMTMQFGVIVDTSICLLINGQAFVSISKWSMIDGMQICVAYRLTLLLMLFFDVVHSLQNVEIICFL